MILKRSRAGEVSNISVLVAIGVGTDGFRQILGVAECELSVPLLGSTLFSNDGAFHGARHLNGFVPKVAHAAPSVSQPAKRSPN